VKEKTKKKQRRGRDIHDSYMWKPLFGIHEDEAERKSHYLSFRETILAREGKEKSAGGKSAATSSRGP